MSIRPFKETYSFYKKTPKLTETDKKTCEGKLTLQSCWNALNSMKNGKSPGNCGLTKEFYVCFFAEIAAPLV